MIKKYLYKKYIQPKDSYFRAGVGIVLLDANGRVILFERSDKPGEFQLVQGGLDVNEEPYPGIIRELFEETGITESDISNIYTVDRWLTYLYPRALAIGSSYMGQTQQWYIARLNDDVEINLEAAPDDEFVSYKWVDQDNVVDAAVDFKKPLYETLVQEIGKFHKQ